MSGDVSAHVTGASGFDVLVVGDGVAGASAALVLGRAQRSVLLVGTGVPRNAAAQHSHGWLTREGASPDELAELAAGELDALPSVTRTDGWVEEIGGDSSAHRFSIGGDERTARAVVLATGVADELPDVPGIADLWGRLAFTCPYCHGWELKARPLIVLGSGDGAAWLALLVSRWSDDVVLCTAGEPELDDESLAALDRARVRVDDRTVASVDDVVDQVQLTFHEGEERRGAGVFVKTGMHPRNELAIAVGCELDDDGFVLVDADQQTSVPGVFAAGDVAQRADQSVGGFQLAVAVGAGALAALACDAYLVLDDYDLGP